MTPNFGIRLQGIVKSFPSGESRAAVLTELDWVIEPGEIAVLMGASGSGKSTLINLVAGLEQPDAGQILFQWTNGKSLAWQTLSDVAQTRFRLRHIGVVYQFFNLIPTLTVWENVLLPLHLAGSTAADRKRMQTLLDTVGLRSKADTLPQNLSGGEQQRAAIVRALANVPSLILADEPTGNLDAQTSQRVMELMVQLSQAQGATLLVATHAMEWISVAQTVTRLENGRLVPIP